MQYHVDFYNKVMIQSGSLRVHLISSNALIINIIRAFFISTHYLKTPNTAKNLVTHLVTPFKEITKAVKDIISVHPIGFEPMTIFLKKVYKRLFFN